MDNIYSPESIALTRRRAAAIRAQVERGELERTWIETADELDASAARREAFMSTMQHFHIDCTTCSPTQHCANHPECIARAQLTYDVTDYDAPTDPASLVDCEGCQ